jgi:hypothetical protein
LVLSADYGVIRERHPHILTGTNAPKLAVIALPVTGPNTCMSVTTLGSFSVEQHYIIIVFALKMRSFFQKSLPSQQSPPTTIIFIIIFFRPCTVSILTKEQLNNPQKIIFFTRQAYVCPVLSS